MCLWVFPLSQSPQNLQTILQMPAKNLHSPFCYKRAEVPELTRNGTSKNPITFKFLFIFYYGSKIRGKGEGRMETRILSMWLYLRLHRWYGNLYHAHLWKPYSIKINLSVIRRYIHWTRNFCLSETFSIITYIYNPLKKNNNWQFDSLGNSQVNTICLYSRPSLICSPWDRTLHGWAKYSDMWKMNSTASCNLCRDCSGNSENEAYWDEYTQKDKCLVAKIEAKLSNGYLP